jgi:dUTP pyrophosphatase
MRYEYIMLNIYKLNPNAFNPTYATTDSACFDLSACLEGYSSTKGFYKDNEPVTFLCIKDETGIWIRVPSGARVLIPTGMIFDIPQNHSVKIYARSGLSLKRGLALANGVGVVDSDYVEEVFVPIINNSDEEICIKHGDRIAQGELVLVRQAEISYINERPQQKSDRNGGFGSTGVSK